VKAVGATLGHQRDLGAAGIAGIGIGVGSGHPEFLDRVGRHIQHTGKGVTIVLIVNPNAVERDVRLVAPHTVDCAASCVFVLIQLVPQIRHPGLQAQQLNYVAVGDGQFCDLVLLESIAERRVGAIDERRLAFDRHRGRHTRNLQPNGYGGGRFDNERDVRRQIGCKTLRLCLQAIFSRRYFQELVEPCRIACRVPLQPCCRVRQSNLYPGNTRARRVRNAAIQLACCLPHRQRGQARQHYEQPSRTPCFLRIPNADLRPTLVLPVARFLMDSRHRHSLQGRRRRRATTREKKSQECSSSAPAAPFRFTVLILGQIKPFPSRVPRIIP